MANTVSRLFGSESQAQAAADALRADGYRDVHVFPGAAPAAAEATADPDVLKAMMDAYIYRPHAKIYAARVAQGESLVTVHAIWGTAQHALNVMNGLGALPNPIPKAPIPARLVYNPHTPFSTMLTVPTLTEKIRLPFEETSGISSLTRGPGLFSETIFPLLSRAAAPFSGLLGLATQTKSSTPLSSLLGMPTLSSNATPFSSLFRLPVLSRK